ncbi:MAG: OsmC family protein [Candidatus Izemoplasmatales bacterium]|nr:OsmC family protein [Candidatus Izemoplasmatales bacterium]
MAVDQIKLSFSNEFVGEMTSPTGTVKIGAQEGGMAPYHLLFGALGGCFYSTFLSISKKKRLTFDRARLEIDGVKRTGEIPTLEEVTMRLIVKNPSNTAGIQRSAELGTHFCSIHNTISQVAKMNLIVEFE